MVSSDSRNLLLTLLAHADLMGGDDQLALLAYTQDSAFTDPNLIAQVGAKSHGSASDEAGEILSHRVFLLGYVFEYII